MQSATAQYAPALSGPDHGLGYPPDLTDLPFDADVPLHTHLSLNPSCTTGSDAWHGSLLGDIDPGYAAAGYATFAAPANDGTILPSGPGLAAAPLTGFTYDIDDTTFLSNAYTGPNLIVTAPAQYSETLATSLPAGDVDASLLLGAEAFVDINGWCNFTVDPCVVAADTTVHTTAGSHQGSFDPTCAFGAYGPLYEAYEACSSYNNLPSSVTSPVSVSDRASIFSPAASLSFIGTAPVTPDSSTFSSPAPAPVVVPPKKRERKQDALRRHRRVRSSASQPAKPSHTTPTFLSGGIHTTAPRNKQVPTDEIKEPVRCGSTWICAHCSYRTPRESDMSRHMETHSEAVKFVCCGVSAEDVSGYVGEIHYHEGRAMVGGCAKTFRRKDAFLRHLRLRKGRCLRPAYLTLA